MDIIQQVSNRLLLSLSITSTILYWFSVRKYFSLKLRKCFMLAIVKSISCFSLSVLQIYWIIWWSYNLSSTVDILRNLNVSAIIISLIMTFSHVNCKDA